MSSSPTSERVPGHQHLPSGCADCASSSPAVRRWSRSTARTSTSPRGVLLDPGTLGLGQDDDPAHDRRVRAADRGTIELAGDDVTHKAAVRPGREHGLPGLRPLPAHERRRNVEYGRCRRSARPSAGRVPARRSSGAPRRLRRPQAHQLSGGQRQRVALARALVNRPRLLLLDEPLGALDLKLRQQMQVELKEIQREVGITFLFVTHDQEEALTMSDRIAVVNAGRIEQVGAPPRSTSSRRTRSWPTSWARPTCWRAPRRARHRAARHLRHAAREAPPRRARDPSRAGRERGRGCRA